MVIQKPVDYVVEKKIWLIYTLPLVRYKHIQYIHTHCWRERESVFSFLLHHSCILYPTTELIQRCNIVKTCLLTRLGWLELYNTAGVCRDVTEVLLLERRRLVS